MKLIRVVNLNDSASGHTDMPGYNQNNIIIHEEAHNEIQRSRNAVRLMYFTVFLMGLSNGLNIFMLSPMIFPTDNFMIIWKNDQILASICFLFYALFGFLARRSVENLGHKVLLMTNCILHLFGDLAIYIGFSLHVPRRSLALMILGQGFTAGGFSLSLELPGKLEMIWLGKGNTVRNTLFFASLLFGAGIKYAILAANIKVHTVAELFKIIILCKVAVVAITLVVGFIAACEASKLEDYHFSSESSISSPRVRDKSRYPCTSISSTLATQGYAVYFALVPPIFIFLQRAFADEITGHKLTSLPLWLSSAAALSAVIGISCGAVLFHCKNRLKLVGACATLLSGIFILVFTYSLTEKKSLNLSIVFLLAWAITAVFWQALGITYNTSLSNSSMAGIKYTECLVCGSFYVVILIQFNEWVMNVYGFKFVGYFHSALYLVSFLLVVASKPTRAEIFTNEE